MMQNKLLLAFALVLVAGSVKCIQVATYGSLYHPEARTARQDQSLYGYEPEIETHARHEKEGQDLNKIPGVPGHDYPVYHEVPPTNFHCADVPATPGMYANVETGCQAYHVCHDGREGHQGASFLCTNGTIFNQKEFTCDWWYNVDCNQATSYYHLNADPEHNPYFPKKKVEEVAHDPHGRFVIQA